MSFQYELASIGAGNMAEGILAAVVQKRLYPAAKLAVSDPVAERREFFTRQFGIAGTDDNRKLVAESRRVILAVKPQMFPDVAAGLADVVTGEHLLISIMAGYSSAKIESFFPKVPVRVVRVMPNLPVKVGAGIAGVCGGRNATDLAIAETRAILDAGGSTVLVGDEGLIDAVTAVSGSGPAYFYAFVEAIVAGGVECGLSEADALKLAEYTCLGAARMMLETGEPPAELRRKVTSKAGTTQAALEHMARAGVPDGIRDAVKAAFKRARELGA